MYFINRNLNIWKDLKIFTENTPSFQHSHRHTLSLTHTSILFSCQNLIRCRQQGRYSKRRGKKRNCYFSSLILSGTGGEDFNENLVLFPPPTSKEMNNKARFRSTSKQTTLESLDYSPNVRLELADDSKVNWSRRDRFIIECSTSFGCRSSDHWSFDMKQLSHDLDTGE